MVEALKNYSPEFHPDLDDIVAENGTLDELGDLVINRLRDEYLKEGVQETDAKKLKDITKTLGVDCSDVFEISGEDGLLLHDNYLATGFLKLCVSKNPKKLQAWLGTTKAALDYKAPIDLVLTGQFNKVVGYVADALKTNS